MKNVLVFPCGSEIGLELFRSLSRSTHFTLFGASSVPDHGEYVYDEVRHLPFVDDVAFSRSLNTLVKKLAIDYIFPAHDDAITVLTGLREAGDLAAEVVAPSCEVCRVCRSKSTTYRRFGGAVPVPQLYDPRSLSGLAYPIFTKPDAGQGSRGAAVLPDLLSAREHLRLHPDALVMEYLSGREYTVDCFTDQTGRLLFLSSRERLRIQRGISVSCREVDSPALRRMGVGINAALAMRGAWFFQARENGEGEPVLLEVAPRIAGSSGFQRGKGINLPLLTLYDRMGLPVKIDQNIPPALRYDRALTSAFRTGLEYDAVYVDYDDTLVFRNQVNTGLVRFLYHCLNKGRRLVVLSRREDDLAGELRKRRLDSLFDEVIVVPPDRRKSEFIKERRSICIDDSFAERHEIHTALRIPVYDPSCIEVLFEE